MSPVTEKLLETVERAASPSDLGFGGGEEADAARYKELLVAIHPDRVLPAERPRAEEAAQKLAKLHQQAQRKPSASAARVGKWVIESPLVKGDIADLWLVASEKDGDGVLKIARSAADNDLMGAEVAALRALAKAEPAEYRKYVPVVADAFSASGRRATVFQRRSGLASLAEIGRAFPEGVPFRHVVWMMNRLLSALKFAGNAGFVHGAVTPDHLLYDPKTHGMLLVGWGACSKGEPVKVISEAWKSLYPEEVTRRRACYHETDLYMAAKSMEFAAGGRVPARFRRLMEWCTAPSPYARPGDTFEFQDAWQEVARQEYGKPTFVELSLPKK